MLGPEFVQSFAAQRAVAHNALRFQSIDNFPRLADAHTWRQFFPKLSFQPATAPHSFHENGLEDKRLIKLQIGHDSSPYPLPFARGEEKGEGIREIELSHVEPSHS